MRPRHLLAAAAGLIISGVLIGAPIAGASAATGTKTAAGAETAKKKSSWELKSEVNFNGSTLPDGCVKYTGAYTAGDSAWSADNATMSGGELKLKVEKKKTNKQPYTTGGMGCWNWPQTYGKFEIKAKVPTGAGINSYITLSPAKDNSANGLTSIELLAPDKDTAYVSNGYGKGSEQAFSEQDFAKAWHTYTIEWAPSHLLVQLDGKEIFWSDKAYKGSRWISMATTTGDSLTGTPTKATKLPKYFEITSMKMYKYTGVKPTPGTTLSVPAAGATPSASVSASPGASSSPSATAVAAASNTNTPASSSNKLTGGIWPWLIGGSVMVVTALVILSYPSHRRHKKQKQREQAQRRQPDTYSRPY